MSIKIRKETKVEPDIWKEEKTSEAPDVINSPLPDYSSSPIDSKNQPKNIEQPSNKEEGEMSVETYNK